MATPHEEMARLVFDVLSGKGHEIYMYDEKGNQVFSPEKANRLWSADEKLMVSLGWTKGRPPKPLITFYTSDVTNIDRFNDIKFTLKKHNPWDFSFDTEHFGRSLEPKHFKHLNVTETQKWTGSTRTSYLPVDGCMVVVKHNRPWNKEMLEQAQRWRRIRQVMLHTPDGERFKFPFNHILGAKAMAQHLNHNNHMHDEDGKLIQDLTKTLTSLRRFQTRSRKLGADDLLTQVQNTQAQIKKLLSQISDSGTYGTSLTQAREFIRDWKTPKLESATATFREARELQSWFEDFEPKLMIESDDRKSEVYAAWKATDHNKYRTLDYLKRNVPGWLSRFEADPEEVTTEITNYVTEFEKDGK